MHADVCNRKRENATNNSENQKQMMQLFHYNAISFLVAHADKKLLPT